MFILMKLLQSDLALNPFSSDFFIVVSAVFKLAYPEHGLIGVACIANHDQIIGSMLSQPNCISEISFILNPLTKGET
jgi:hypothetical protein